MELIIDRLFHEFTPPFSNSVLIFTIILLIIFISPLLLRKIKIPSIIVLILCGLIIGPHGFNLIEKGDAVKLFSTIGLLYIMFLAGLELNLTEFARNKHKSYLFGFFTFIIPLLIGFPVCYNLLGYGFMTSLLTASMFSTHTLIAYPIVSKMDLTKNEAVAITVGGTIITDTAVLVILAIINGTHSGASGWTHWLPILFSFSVFFVFIFKLVPMVAHWVLKRVENERYSHFIFVLGTVFCSAFVAELAGLEAIIGAFMAGLVVNKLIPKTSPLMSRIEFAGNALFIPFFLISVGMVIDLNSLFAGSATLIVAVALTTTALLGKFFAAQITSKVLKYSTNQRNLIFGLSSSHAVATLAVITVGYEMGLIDQPIMNGTILLILVTCIIGSLVTESAGKAMIISHEAKLTPDATVPEDRILVPISNPQTMTDLMDLALNLTEHKKHEPVFALTVVDDDTKVMAKLAESREILGKLIKHASETERKIDIISTIDQNISNGIRRVIKEVSATDLVIGSSPKSRFADLIFGNLINNILANTNQEIFVYKPMVPVMNLTHLRILCPAYSEMETGFARWFHKLTIFAFNLNLKCTFYGNKNLALAVENVSTNLQAKPEIDFIRMESLNASELQSISTIPSDLIVLIKARKNSVSYTHEIDQLLPTLETLKSENSLLIVTPRQND
ncbi:cation:proton antiporter [Mangrovibacterium sp.]|uniref:cation:proton antiporter domain-containing protein n=1 Tax=Mangrovibacterium sp. TaxID=1961364 RepID=UPI003561B4CB